MIDPVPTVTISPPGRTLVASPADGELQPGTLMLDDLEVTWGRTTYLDHHQAQTAKFTVLYEGPGQIGALTGADNWGGWPVTMSWTSGGTTRTFFRGRVNNYTVRPRKPHAVTGERRGAFVDLECVGQLTEVAQRLTATETWPAESGAARIARIAAVIGSTLAGVDYRDYWDGAPMAARSVDSTDALSLLQAMVDSTDGDRMTYDPHTNRVGFIQRRRVTGAVSRTRLRNYAAAYPGGVHIQPVCYGQDGPGGTIQAATLWPMLDARWIEGGWNGQGDPTARVTRCIYHWTNSDGTQGVGVSADSVAEADRGIVAMDLSTELAQSDWAGIAAVGWLDMLWKEGFKIQLDPMVYRADKAGGFDTIAAAQLLIGGAELADSMNATHQGAGSSVFIAGTVWSGIGSLPVYGVIGGTIRYVGGGWRPTIHLMRPSWEGGPFEGPIAIQDLKANTSADSFTLDSFGHSITWDDLYWVNT